MPSSDSTLDEQALCRCSTGLPVSHCCQPIHDGEARATTAEALMRSRFSAYVLHNKEYLLASWDKSKCPTDIDFSKEENVDWQRLEILSKKKGGEKDSKGIVEFKAYYLLEGEEYAMHEISRFIKQDGRWFYLDGQVKSVGKVNQQVNQGKNAPCACGSGKKFKRCCGK